MREWLNRTHIGDCRALLAEMVADGIKVQTCVTSPPYFGLRDYGTGTWEGGSESCDHDAVIRAKSIAYVGTSGFSAIRESQMSSASAIHSRNGCPSCGATKIDMQIGLESDPLQYVAQLVAVFDMVREILQPDGTLWLNLGDSYASGGMSEPSEKTTLGGGRERGGQTLVRTIPKGTKAKDLLGIPWMVAFALRNNGWYLRSDVIWHKPNPMPESVTDRPTKSHEYVFLLAKSGRYYYDQEAIAEQVAYSTVQRLTQPNLPDQIGSDRIPGKTNGNMKAVGGLETRNRRSVWTIATQPFDGAHFATFPQALIEPCILAGARPGDTVLDPFMGSGTTGQVATNLGRNFVGCELNPKYVDLHEMRSTTIGMPW